MSDISKTFLLLFIVPRLIGPRLEFAIPISMSENGKRTNFAEFTKQSKNEIHGNDKSSYTYSYSLFQY